MPLIVRCMGMRLLMSQSKTPTPTMTRITVNMDIIIVLVLINYAQLFKSKVLKDELQCLFFPLIALNFF